MIKIIKPILAHALNCLKQKAKKYTPKLKSYHQQIKNLGSLHYWKNIWQQFQRHIHHAKQHYISQKHLKKITKKLSCYWVIGLPNSGKTHIINHFKTPTPPPKKLIDYLHHCFKKTPPIISNDTVFFESQLSLSDSNQPIHLLAKTLPRWRPHQPLNGLIIVLTPEQLLNAPYEQFIQLGQQLSDNLEIISRALNSQIPVYFIINKIDQISGFDLLAQQLDFKTQQECCGATLSPTTSTQYSTWLTTTWQTLVQHFQQHTFSISRNLTHTAEIQQLLCFPWQLQLLQAPLVKLIQNIFSQTKAHQYGALKGYYLTSIKQTDLIQDFVMQKIQQQFQLVKPLIKPRSSNNPIFCQHLLTRGLLPDSQNNGFTHRHLRRKTTLRTVRNNIFGMFLLVVLGFTWQSELTYQQFLQQATPIVRTADQLHQSITPQNDTLTLPLDLILQVNKLHYLISNFSITQNLLAATWRLKLTTKHLTRHIQKQLFLPRIAFIIETILKNSSLTLDNRYAFLKAYLAFAPNITLSTSAVYGPLYRWWIINHNLNMATARRALQQIKDAFESDQVPKLPLNWQLIHQNQKQLASISPLQRAYTLLIVDSLSSPIPNLYLQSISALSEQTLFKIKYINKAIPALYTQKGFQQTVLPHYAHISQQVITDNDILNLNIRDNSKQSLSKQLLARYNQLYLSHWQQALSAISIRPVKQWPKLITTFKQLAQPNSPLAQLLYFINQQTHNVHYTQISVANKYRALNMFTNNNLQYFNLDTLEQVFNQLFQQLQSLQTKKVAQSFIYLSDALSEHQDNALYQLARFAKHTPKPLSVWLTSLVQQTCEILWQHSVPAIQLNWQQLTHAYHAQIANKFPVDPSAQSQISITAFTQFFGPNGVLTQFINKWITPISASQAHYKKLLNFKINLNPALISVASRLKMIQSNYFPNAHLIKLKLTVSPVYLSANRRYASLTIFGQHDHYEFGPIKKWHWYWPASSKSPQSADINLPSFTNLDYNHSYLGPWSIFNLLKLGQWNTKTQDAQFTWSMTDPHLIFKLNVNSNATLKTLTLEPLTQFTLPKQLLTQ